MDNLKGTATAGKRESVLTPGPQKTRTPEDYYRDWQQTQKEEDLHKVLRSLEPTVKKGVNNFGKGRQELKTQARILARDAVQSYDPEQKAKLSSWTYGHLQRLKRYAADREEAVRLPERSRMDAIFLRDEAEKLEEELGYEPDVLSLQERTGLSRGRIQKARKAFREIAEAGVTSEKGDTLLKAEINDQEDPWITYVYYDLDPKNRKILEWSTGYNGTEVLSKKEIAKHLGISPPAVSSRIDTITKHLQERPSGELV